MKITKTALARYFKSHEFKRGWMMTTLMTLVGFVFYVTHMQEHIVGVCLGILLTAFVDQQGSTKHRNIAMGVSVLLNTCILIGANIIAHQSVLMTLFIGLVSFGGGYIVLYGNRVGMLSFSALLTLVLSMVRFHEGRELWIFIAVVALGAVLYIISSHLYHLFTKKHQVRQQLGELTALTGKYLCLRAEETQASRLNIKAQILEKEVAITELQDSIRTILLSQRMKRGISKTREQHVLTLIELIDIFEAAVATPTLFEKLKMDVEAVEEYLVPLASVLDTCGRRLEKIAQKVLDGKAIEYDKSLRTLVDEVEELVDSYVEKIGLPEARQGALSMMDVVAYLKQQVSSIISVARLVQNKEVDLTVPKGSEAKGFLTTQDYSLVPLKENFSFQSPILRHAVRLSITMMVAYIIGLYLNPYVSNAYWIMLTIIIILKPQYGITMGRSKQRLLGTIVGVLLAIILIITTQNMWVYLVLTYITMIAAFSLVSRNFFGTAIAITLNVILVFSLLQPNTWAVVESRLVHTFIGAGLSLLSGYILFPVWEYETIHTAIKKVLKANVQYLNTTKALMQGDAILEYKLKRKNAFLASSNLYAAFQRLASEPKSKQKHIHQYYNFVVIHQKILSVIADIGSFVREDFSPILPHAYCTIIDDLASQIDSLSQPNAPKPSPSAAHEKAMKEILAEWNERVEERDAQLAAGETEIDEALKQVLQQFKFFYDEAEFLQELILNLWSCKIFDSNS